MRRSPAAESKLSAPLPLDLHVLSLSLAFILSQDQTLRCCYLVFFFSKDCVSHTSRQPRRTASPAAFIKHSGIRRYKYRIFKNRPRNFRFLAATLAAAGALALVLLYFVYCKSFNVLLTGLPFRRSEKRCKVRNLFRLVQIFFADFFSLPFQTPASGPLPFGLPGFLPESECKGRHFCRNHQIFSQEIFKNYVIKHVFTHCHSTLT